MRGRQSVRPPAGDEAGGEGRRGGKGEGMKISVRWEYVEGGAWLGGAGGQGAWGRGQLKGHRDFSQLIIGAIKMLVNPLYAVKYLMLVNPLYAVKY